MKTHEQMVGIIETVDSYFFFFQAEDGIRDIGVTGVQTCALPIFVDREVIGYTVAVADATRRPAAYGLDTLEPLIEWGASPRGPIGLVQAARALALLRGRSYVKLSDVRDLAADVLRHRIVLSYEALSEDVSADDVIERVVSAIMGPREEQMQQLGSAG